MAKATVKAKAKAKASAKKAAGKSRKAVAASKGRSSGS